MNKLTPVICALSLSASACSPAQKALKVTPPSAVTATENVTNNTSPPYKKEFETLEGERTRLERDIKFADDEKIGQCIETNNTCLEQAAAINKEIKAGMLFKECEARAEKTGNNDQSECEDNILREIGKYEDLVKIHGAQNECLTKIMACLSSNIAENKKNDAQRRTRQKLEELDEVQPLAMDLQRQSDLLEAADAAIPSKEKIICPLRYEEAGEKFKEAAELMHENPSVSTYIGFHDKAKVFLSSITGCLEKMKTTAEASPVMSRLYKEQTVLNNSMNVFPDAERVSECESRSTITELDDKVNEVFQIYVAEETPKNRIAFLTEETKLKREFVDCMYPKS